MMQFGYSVFGVASFSTQLLKEWLDVPGFSKKYIVKNVVQASRKVRVGTSETTSERFTKVLDTTMRGPPAGRPAELVKARELHPPAPLLPIRHTTCGSLCGP